MKRISKLILYVLIAIVLVIAGFRLAAVLRETQSLEEARPATGRVLETAQGDIFVTTTGSDGPPVLLLHGTGAWGGLWQETADALSAAGYEAHAMDLPPFGFSERPEDHDYSRQAQARRVIATARALGTRPVLVAHSFGASAGVEAALRDPDAFDGLVIVAGALGVGTADDAAKALPFPLRSLAVRQAAVSLTATNPLAIRSLLAQMLYRKERASEVYAEILKQPLRVEGSTAAVADWAPSLLVPPAEALSTRASAYRTLPLQTEIIWGDQDSITPLAQGEALHGLIPDSEMTVLVDVGHVPQVEDPAALQAALISALDRISGGTD